VTVPEFTRILKFLFYTLIMPRSNRRRSRRSSKRSQPKQSDGSKINLTQMIVSNPNRSRVMNPPPGAQVYRGPVPNSINSANDYIVAELSLTQVLSTTATGSVSSQLAINPTGTPNFSAYAGLYEEYRVLAARLDYNPIALNFATTQVSTSVPLIVYVSRNSTLAIASTYALAAEYTDRIVVNTSEKWTKFWRMSGSLESQFYNTSGPASVGAFNVVGPANGTVGINVGYYTITYWTQFRNKD